MATEEAISTPPAPGSLRSKAEVIIQTREAQRLLLGRPRTEDRPGIIGLAAFARILHRVWVAAQYDDPFADLCLLRVEDQMRTTREWIGQRQEMLRSALGSMAGAGVHIDVAVSVEPIRVPLAFSHPYGYMAAYLIAEADGMVRQILTARHCGLMDRDQSRHLLEDQARLVRRTLQTCTDWKQTGVTRQHLRSGTQLALQALSWMGDLPADVLDGKRRAAHAPAILTAAQLARRSALATAGEEDEDEEDENQEGEEN